MKKFLAYAFAGIILVASGCNDGSIIGNELLGDEAIDLKYDDNFVLSGRTVKGDSVATYRRGAVHQTYLLGELDDPIFGKSSSDIYTAMQFGASLPTFNLDDSVIDSIVLELEYDTLGFYGDDNVVHNFEVYRVEEDWLSRDTIYNDESFATSMTLLGSKSLIPDPTDSINWQVRTTAVDSFITLSPRLSIRLDNSFGTELIMDSTAQQTDADFIESFKGLYIKSNTEGSSMAGFNFSENRTVSEIIGKVAVYFTQTDDDGEELLRTYNYYLRSETYSEFTFDNDLYPVGEAIDNDEIGDDYLYSQGMAGVNCEVDFPDLSDLKGSIINSARLVLTVAEGDEYFTDTYPGLTSFLVSKYEDDDRILIDDLTKTNVDISTALILLDGTPDQVTLENGEEVTTVTFNITDYISNSIKDDNISPRVVISPVGRSESPRRTVFYGVNHPTYPAKLRIAYTTI